jgi:hypothetical protein
MNYRQKRYGRDMKIIKYLIKWRDYNPEFLK